MSIRMISLRALAVCGLLAGTSVARGEEISYLSTSETNFVARIEALESELANLRHSSGGGGGCATGSCGCSDGGIIAGAELVMLTPHTGSIQLLDATGATLVVTPEYNFTGSPRLWAGYRNADGLGFRARYWTFDANAGPVAPLGIVRGLHMEALDLEVTQTEQLFSWNFDLSAGLRWAQDRNTTLLNQDNTFTQDFQGVGGTIGLSAWRPVGSRGLSLFVNSRASLIFGDNNFPVGPPMSGLPISLPPPVTGLLSDENEVVSIYEMQLGVEWSRMNDNGSRFYIRTALEAQAWNVPSVALGLLDNTTGLFGAAIAMGFNH